eukprot:5439441-Alexandrium_andersonii.AAC.1
MRRRAVLAALRERPALPQCIVEALALGSLTALRKDDGRVRGIVAGDAFRRIVARAMAQQAAEAFEEAC